VRKLRVVEQVERVSVAVGIAATRRVDALEDLLRVDEWKIGPPHGHTRANPAHADA